MFTPLGVPLPAPSCSNLRHDKVVYLLGVLATTLSPEEILPWTKDPRIPPAEALALHLYYAAGRKQVEIAEFFGMTQAAVSYRIQRALSRIEFILSLPEVQEKDLRRDLPTVLTDPVHVEILVGVWKTSCQSAVADQLGLSQGKVRHRFFKAVKVLQTTPGMDLYRQLFERIGEGWNMFREVKLPQWDRPLPGVQLGENPNPQGTMPPRAKPTSPSVPIRTFATFDQRIRTLLKDGEERTVDAHYEALDLKNHPSLWATEEITKFEDIVASHNWWTRHHWRVFERTAALFSKDEIKQIGLQAAGRIASQPEERRTSLKERVLAYTSTEGKPATPQYVTQLIQKMRKKPPRKRVSDLTRKEALEYIRVLQARLRRAGISVPTVRETFA